ncbi:MAG TPA: tRNA (N6-isopentenyl adenosine(37)-C2)-methylthiotransferase MiaB [Thermoanaerobaculia bacterium]|nr:tRNA (N6-isopentenyl adenosine(37)-C2)-methylthiotransferase MiaB [Thermoanaerobaculia bacterium]
MNGSSALPALPGASGSYRVETWGCQMNVLDGERMAGQLERLGLSAAPEGSDTDVVVLNTCSVRDKADQKVYSALGVLAERKRENPSLVIGVAGCLAQVTGDQILERAPWVDFVLGTGNVERLGEVVEQVRRERFQGSVLDLPEDSPVYQFRQISRGSKFQAYLTVIEGCDQFCTFCIVPFTRGRERSRRASEIAEEAAWLVGQGYSEITLLGQTVNAYQDPEDSSGLGSLLSRVAAVPGLRRLRFLTSHPSFVDDSLVEALGSGGILAPFLHMPAQSGSDRVLYRMKRRYDRKGYLDTLARVRRVVPDVAVSSDFIVGFPGETEEDFGETLDLVREARFANVFAFCYSPRPGTAAARWGSEKRVPAEVASARLQRLLALQAEVQSDINRGLEGRTFEVLVEGCDREGQAHGRTACNRIVHVRAGEPLEAGTYRAVKILKGLPNSLLGELAAQGARGTAGSLASKERTRGL